MSYTPGAQDISVTNFAYKFPVSASLADATANPSTTIIGAALEGFNGITWDRIRTSVSGTITQLTGVLNVMPVSQYLTTRATLVDQQSTNFMGNSRGDLSTVDAELIAGEDATVGCIFTAPLATASATGTSTPYASVAKVGTVGISVSAAAGRVYRLRGINSHTANEYFLLLCDKASAPVNNDLPIDVMRLAPTLATSLQSTDVPLEYGTMGKKCVLGVAYAISTTSEKVTLPSSSDVMVFGDFK